MASVTVHSDSRAQENKICHSFYFPFLSAMKCWDPYGMILAKITISTAQKLNSYMNPILVLK